mgnify:FL=1
MNIGQRVTLCVQSCMYAHYSWCDRNPIQPSTTYVGTVEHCEWIDSRVAVAFRTDDQVLRIAQLNRLSHIDGIKFDYIAPVSKASVVIVQGSKPGTSYTVTIDRDGKATKCTCPGFGFRRTCKHILNV